MSRKRHYKYRASMRKGTVIEVQGHWTNLLCSLVSPFFNTVYYHYCVKNFKQFHTESDVMDKQDLMRFELQMGFGGVSRACFFVLLGISFFFFFFLRSFIWHIQTRGTISYIQHISTYIQTISYTHISINIYTYDSQPVTNSFIFVLSNMVHIHNFHDQ